jgi:hypothetical protein
MLYGKVLRPRPTGEAYDIDLGRPRRIDGVVVVRDGDFVGVVRSRTRTSPSERSPSLQRRRSGMRCRTREFEAV